MSGEATSVIDRACAARRPQRPRRRRGTGHPGGRRPGDGRRAVGSPAADRGPEGVGKEHVARAIHDWSSRKNAPFVVVSCTAVSDALLGREIFGCSESAHPSLPEEYAGALMRAAGGTLLIEAIDRLPASVCEQLLKTIADGRFQREGDGASAPLRTRLMATVRDTSERSPFGDLPHHVIRIGRLTERREDILPLAAHFLGLFAEELAVKPVGFTADARNALLGEEWPGNVRELAERVRQAIKLSGRRRDQRRGAAAGRATASTCPPSRRPSAPSRPAT